MGTSGRKELEQHFFLSSRQSSPLRLLAQGGSIDQTGTYTAGATSGVFTVAATDGAVSGSATVTISGSPPSADAGGPYTGDEGSAIVLDGSGSTDANNFYARAVGKIIGELDGKV